MIAFFLQIGQGFHNCLTRHTFSETEDINTAKTGLSLRPGLHSK